MPDLTTTSPTALPTGTWEVDPAASRLGFRARGMFGLVPVNGTFSSFDGELRVDDGGASGELRIDAASLDTGNDKRDTHLRSADFFDVDNAPTVMFSVAGVAVSGSGLELTGLLQIRENRHRVVAPLEVSHDGDRLRLATALSVDRAEAGVGWSKAGMIKGKAHLDAEVVLRRVD